MAEHNELGKKGEQIATQLLTKKRYKILETNWTLGRLEIDIIAANRREIVFVEVKTRSSELGGLPEEAVDENKRRHMIVAANAYLKLKQDKRTLRFDIIGILINKSGEIEQISHLENAFAPNIKTVTTGSFTGKWQWKNRH